MFFLLFTKSVIASQLLFDVEPVVNSSSLFFGWFDVSQIIYPVMEIFLRILRIASVLFVILFTRVLLTGAFKHMTSRGKNDVISEGRHHMVKGAFGIIMMLTLFVVATVAL
ncbi:hypothetical protein CO172_00735 [Candidatus Uhrbacteria bacterium CG_4_9_14_3_um_filter_36_7]|uniref:Uncharacterized protein n=1 Tax=Candidatus Uhrbacteria bacterium CG_4_9_14_3_um_filter_36_7 TaxID=1975033 RepID=A0A2M7XI65_9BACT|nr:MAG: hypothetical protein CO172_00735 [Candidatus Uhrbacteria bacterium CG_4_9_14_3_um_filter_36_7]